jgi:hypothetical protein
MKQNNVISRYDAINDFFSLKTWATYSEFIKGKSFRTFESVNRSVKEYALTDELVAKLQEEVAELQLAVEEIKLTAYASNYFNKVYSNLVEEFADVVNMIVLNRMRITDEAWKDASSIYEPTLSFLAKTAGQFNLTIRLITTACGHKVMLHTAREIYKAKSKARAETESKPIKQSNTSSEGGKSYGSQREVVKADSKMSNYIKDGRRTGRINFKTR